MPRSASGACSLAEPAFVANTPIVAADANSNNDDIIDMLTDSLSRSGDGGMTAELWLDNDGFTYTTDPNTGMRRTAGDEQAIQCGGVDIIEFTSTGATVNGDLEVTGDLTVDGHPLLLIGEVKIWTSATIPSKWLLMDGSSLLRATYPDLWTFAAAEIAADNTLFTNGNGSTTFTVGTMIGYAPVGVDPSSTNLPSVTHIGDTTGSKSATLAANQIPTLTSSGSNSITVNPSGNASVQVAGVIGLVTATGATAGGVSVPSNSGGTWGGYSAFTGSNSISVNYTNGSQQVTPLVQPSRAFKFIIYAGA